MVFHSSVTTSLLAVVGCNSFFSLGGRRTSHASGWVANHFPCHSNFVHKNMNRNMQMGPLLYQQGHLSAQSYFPALSTKSRPFNGT